MPALAAAAGIALTVALGNWQTRRAEAKLALQAQVNTAARATPVDVGADALRSVPPAELVWRHVRLTGVWQPERVIYLDNRNHGGRAGLYVLMPLLVGNPAVPVLVNRGWLAHDPASRLRIPAYQTPGGTVELTGVVLEGEGRLLELGQAAPPALAALWQNLDLDAYRRVSGLAVPALVVRQDAPGAGRAPTDGLARDWPEAGSALDEQIGKHRGYAVQWYGLALTLVALVVLFEVRKRRRPVPAISETDS